MRVFAKRVTLLLVMRSLAVDNALLSLTDLAKEEAIPGDGANWSSNQIPSVRTCIKIKFGNVLLSFVIFTSTYCLLSENNLTKLNKILLNSIQPLNSIILTSLRHPPVMSKHLVVDF